MYFQIIVVNQDTWVWTISTLSLPSFPTYILQVLSFRLVLWILLCTTEIPHLPVECKYNSTTSLDVQILSKRNFFFCCVYFGSKYVDTTIFCKELKKKGLFPALLRTTINQPEQQQIVSKHDVMFAQTVSFQLSTKSESSSSTGQIGF